jgi:hypothetical protein
MSIFDGTVGNLRFFQDPGRSITRRSGEVKTKCLAWRGLSASMERNMPSPLNFKVVCRIFPCPWLTEAVVLLVAGFVWAGLA